MLQKFIPNAIYTVLIIIVNYLISAIPLFILRDRVYKSAFRGMSKTNIKKIKKSHIILQRVSLFYALRYNDLEKTKLRVLLYYLFCAFVFINGLLVSFSVVKIIGNKIPYLLWFSQIILCAIIWLVNQSNEKNKEETGNAYKPD